MSFVNILLDVVSVHGGHFGASLGVVELTVALHFVYNTPYDQPSGMGCRPPGPMAIKYLQAARITLAATENTMALVVSQNAAKVNTAILLVWGIHPHIYFCCIRHGNSCQAEK